MHNTKSSKNKLATKLRIKYRFKYFISLILVIAFILSIIYFIGEFILNFPEMRKRNLYLLFATIGLSVVSVFLIFLYNIYDIYKDMSHEECILDYLAYFTENTFSDLEFTETVTWCFRYIRSLYLRKEKSENNHFEKTIKAFYSILGNRNYLPYAITHRTLFVSNCAKLLSVYNAPNDSSVDYYADIIRNAQTMYDDDPEKIKIFHINFNKVVEILPEKSIHVYMVVLVFHFIGCLLISNKETWIFVGNLLLYWPADIMAILIYKGFVQQNEIRQDEMQ